MTESARLVELWETSRPNNAHLGLFLLGAFSLADAESLALTDAESGSTWDGLAGRATDGPLTGKQLARVKSTNSFWFGWKDWYPETLVYGLEE